MLNMLAPLAWTLAAAASPAAETNLRHDAPACVVAGHPARLGACTVRPDTLSEGRIYFRDARQPHWYFVEMTNDAGCFWGVLPSTQRSVKRVSYYIELQGEGTSHRTAERSIAVVTDARQCEGARVAATSPIEPSYVGATANAPLTAAGFGDAGGGPSALLLVGGALAAGGGAAVALSHGGGGSEAARVPSPTPDGPASPLPTLTPTATPTAGPTRRPGATATSTPKPTTAPRATATPTTAPTATARSTAAPRSTATATPTSGATATATPTTAATSTPAATATATATTAATAAPTPTPSPSPTVSGAHLSEQARASRDAETAARRGVVWWRSELQAEGTVGRVFVNEALLAEAAPGLREGQFMPRAGTNVVVLEAAGNGRGGQWLVSLGGGIADGSLIPVGGDVTVTASGAAFRLTGRAGERALLTFRSR